MYHFLVYFSLIAACTLVVVESRLDPKLDYNDTDQAVFAWAYYKVSFNASKNTARAPLALSTILSYLANLEADSTRNSSWSRIVHTEDMAKVNYRMRRQFERFAPTKALRQATLAYFNTKDQLDGKVEPTSKDFGISTYAARMVQSNDPNVIRMVNKVMQNRTGNQYLVFLRDPINLPSNIKAIIFNSVVFAGVWKFSFDAEFSKTCYFHPDGRPKQLVELMYLEAQLNVGTFPKYNLDAVELPLQSRSPFSALLLKPTRGNITEMVMRINPKVFDEIFLKLTKRKVEIELPSFTIVNNRRTQGSLTNLGLESLFAKSTLKITKNSPPVALGDIIQRTTIQVAKTGSKPAEPLLDRSAPFSFVANRPFLIVIFDKLTLNPVLIAHYAYPSHSPLKPKRDTPEEELCHPVKEKYST